MQTRGGRMESNDVLDRQSHIVNALEGRCWDAMCIVGDPDESMRLLTALGLPAWPLETLILTEVPEEIPPELMARCMRFDLRPSPVEA